MFTSLTCFSVKYIDGWLCNSWMAPQLCTENFPRLQHLELGGPFDPSPAGQALSNLASLVLRLNDWGPLCIIQHPFLQKLTSLTLSGHAETLWLDPSSIQLLLLKRFVCKARDGYILVHAIVAPNLVHIKYSSGEWIGLADDQWDLLTLRYPNVTDLVLPQCDIDGSNKIASFQFPTIHHVTLHKHGIHSLFGPRDDTTAAMYWLDLETLTVENLNGNSDDGDDRDNLIAWLQRRQQMGQPNLLVNLMFSKHWNDIRDISGLCLALHQHCTLEVAGIHFNPTVDLIFRDKLSVCAFPPPSCCMLRFTLSRLAGNSWRKSKENHNPCVTVKAALVQITRPSISQTGIFYFWCDRKTWIFWLGKSKCMGMVVACCGHHEVIDLLKIQALSDITYNAWMNESNNGIWLKVIEACRINWVTSLQAYEEKDSYVASGSSVISMFVSLC